MDECNGWKLSVTINEFGGQWCLVNTILTLSIYLQTSLDYSNDNDNTFLSLKSQLKLFYSSVDSLLIFISLY